MKNSTASKLIGLLRLHPHPEGGYYRETYRSQEKIHSLSKDKEFPAHRNISTAIYFLLPQGSRSKLHRIRSDELWHFYSGGTLIIVEITPKGKLIKTSLGTNIAKGETPQHLVPAGNWFGAYPKQKTEFALVGCTVAPGFDFRDLKFGSRGELLSRYPKAKLEILKLSE
jgi:uncharacterized protein